ncbi:MAG TPA: hypothetical protein VGY48_04870 [Vicinamibacterales bacterium]|jgi:transcriptional regulator of aromatic amino acid metabolism|nr:hypothetical protein [Vicinamibacterales bacterium]
MDARRQLQVERAAVSFWCDLQVIVGAYRPHTLLVGPSEATASILESLLADFVQPVWFHDCATAIDLPDEAATVVLKGLEALDVRAQHALMARLDRADARQQIISLSERSPFALVQRGQFLEPLYRRLSVVYLRFDNVEEQPAGAYCA